MKAWWAVALGCCLLAASAPVNALASDWPVFGFDQAHSGNNPQESLIGPTNVGFTLVNAPLFKVSLPSPADGAPVYLGGIPTAQGTRNFLFVTTKAGDIIALDAFSGAWVWHQQFPTGSCRVNGLAPCITTSSPVIDPNRQFVYSYGLDGKVHKLQVADGVEITTGGWPQVATLKGSVEKGSSALSIATASNGSSYLYVTNSGYFGDGGDYQGHLTTINLSTGDQTVFNAECSNQVVHFVATGGTPDCTDRQSGVWARAGAVYDAATNRIYIATGNGKFDPATHGWGDSVLALSPDGTGANGGPVDSYTPTNYLALQNADVDLGSTVPAILPTPSNSKIRNLAAQGGKDGRLRLLNLDDLSGLGGPGHTGGEVGTPINVLGCEILTQPAVWINPADQVTWVFASNACGMVGFKLTVDGTGTPALTQVWQGASGGTSPIVANGVLYQASNGQLRAFDPTTGFLKGSTSIGNIHWESPIVVNGVIYITDESGQIAAYSARQRAVLPAVSNNAYGGYVSAITVQNEGGNPAAPANVAIRYFDQSGESVGVGDVIAGLPVNGSWTVRQDNGHAFPTGGAGSAVIFSDQPVAAFVNEFPPGNIGDATAYSGLAPSPATTQWAPAIANNAYGGYTTGIGLINTGAAATTITITYRDGSGTTVKTQTLSTVPAHAYRGIYSGNSGQLTDAQLPDGFAGTATITAAAGGSIAGVVNETGPMGQFSSYGLVQQAATTLYAPAALNNAYGGFYTGIGVLNTTASAGTVTITYYKEDGSVAATHALPVAANGYLGLYQGDPAVGPPVSGTGYTAQLTSNVAIAAIVNEVAPPSTATDRQFTAYNTFGAGMSTVYLPLVESAGPDGWSTGEGIMNTGTAATTVTVTYYQTSTGAQLGTPVSQTLQPNAFWGAYQPLTGLAAGMRATALITTSSGGLIVAVCNESSPTSFMSYNGQ